MGPYAGRFLTDEGVSKVGDRNFKFTLESFPRGIYFGTRITDTEKGIRGVVTQISDESMTVHYPRMSENGKQVSIHYGPEAFREGAVKVE